MENAIVIQISLDKRTDTRKASDSSPSPPPNTQIPADKPSSHRTDSSPSKTLTTHSPLIELSSPGAVPHNRVPIQKIGAKLYQPIHFWSAKGVVYCFIRAIATPHEAKDLWWGKSSAAQGSRADASYAVTATAYESLSR